MSVGEVRTTEQKRDELRAACDAAMPGPWAWRGNVDSSIELRTVGNGGQRIITTMRSEPCLVWLADDSLALTMYACDSCKAEAAKTSDPFVDYRCPKQENLDTVWLHDQNAHIIKPANAWAVREQPYRGDVARVDHPDAAFIAGARQWVPELLGELDAQAERIAELEAVLGAMVLDIVRHLPNASRDYFQSSLMRARAVLKGGA